MRRLVVYFAILLFSTGCAARHYSATQPGEIKGRLLVQWIDYDQFIFRPDPENPLIFTRYNGDRIEPQRTRIFRALHVRAGMVLSRLYS